MNLREKIRNHQLANGSFHDNLIVWAESWKKSAGLPLDMRYARLGAERLAALRFEHDPGELLIGRPAPFRPDPAANFEAQRFLEENELFLPGQTGHAEPCYDRILTGGLDGLRRDVADIPAFAAAVDGIVAMIENAAQSAPPDLAELCRKIAHRAPETFREALELVWFVMLAIQIGDHAVLVGPGRLDRRLIRFYEADLAAGRIDRDGARRLIETLYLYINDYAPRGLAYAVMVGGRDGSGRDTTNDLSGLCLEALRESRLVYPSVGVCRNADTPEELMVLAVDLIAEGINNVAIFNDDLIRRGMIRYGVPEREAGEYINSTCVEITPCGASNVYVASPYFPLCTILLEYLKTAEANTFAAFRAGYLRRLGAEIEAGAAEQNRIRQIRFDRMRRPIQSLFTRDCIGRKRDIEEGGALYNWVECSFVGLANLADSLAVIRGEVFETHNHTLRSLAELLERDFNGSEESRQRFLHAYPKYGNGDQRVDGEISIITAFLTAQCARQKMFPGDTHFVPGTFCWEMHQRLGAECGATPDGRRASTPFADGAGPAQGRETLGPTAAINSVCSWNHLPMIGGSAFNMKFTRDLLERPGAKETLRQLIETFLHFGGFETQINVLDAGTLEKARRNPEAYADLVVRIGGYTDYFTRLSPGMQEEVMMRTDYQEL